MLRCNRCGFLNADNVRFCGQCGESLVYLPEQQPQPQFVLQSAPAPAITPRRDLFMIGAAGSFLIAVVAMFLGIFAIAALLDGGGLSFTGSLLYLLIIVFTILFFIACILKSIGFLGFYVNYRSNFGIVSLVFGIIAPVLFLLLTFIGIQHQSSWGYYYDYYYVGIQVWFGNIFVGIMLILMGVSFLLIGKYTGVRGASIATGVLLIISGSMLIGLLGFIGVAWFILCAGEFVAGAVFAKAQLAPPPMPAPIPQAY